MITIHCDHCQKKVDARVSGGVRVRTGNRELKLHLCLEHQEELRSWLSDFTNGKAEEVSSPTLKKP